MPAPSSTSKRRPLRPVRPRRLATLLATVAVSGLTACGSPAARSPSAATSFAATACEQITGLEQAVLQKQVDDSVARQTLDAAVRNADRAAQNDPRWQRFDNDIRAVQFDLLTNHPATLEAKATDAAAICSPLAESPPTS